MITAISLVNTHGHYFKEIQAKYIYLLSSYMSLLVKIQTIKLIEE